VNTWVANHQTAQLIGFGTLHPGFEDIEEEIVRIKELGLKGIKFHPEFQNFFVDDPRMDRVYKAIGSDLPVLMHVGDPKHENSSPERLSHVLDRFPDLKLIAAHLGGFKRWGETRKFLLGRNIWLDTSSALWYMDDDEAVDIMRTHGTDRVLFGTDYPFISHADELEKFMTLPLTEQEREDILWNNAAKLLGIDF
jgi:predicted TIM-barrel fold metal-dependent hydrolase